MVKSKELQRGNNHKTSCFSSKNTVQSFYACSIFILKLVDFDISRYLHVGVMSATSSSCACEHVLETTTSLLFLTVIHRDLKIWAM